MSTLLHDVRYTSRLLRRSPGFTVTALTTLALVIGANTAIFSAVRGILLAPLPYRDADRLVRLFEEAPATTHFPMAPADFRDYRVELQTFEGVAAYGRSRSCNSATPDSPSTCGEFRCRPASSVFWATHPRSAASSSSTTSSREMRPSSCSATPCGSAGSTAIPRSSADPSGCPGERFG